MVDRLSATLAALLLAVSIWFLQPASLRWAVYGAYVMGFVAVWVWITAVTGDTIRQRFGGSFERDTARIMNKLKRHGWHAEHDLPIGMGNIDHVLYGTDGAFVLETKWSAHRWTESRIAREAARTWLRARSFRLFAKHHAEVHIDHVTPVLVLWGKAGALVRTENRMIGGVHVVAGTELARVLREVAISSPLESADVRALAETTKLHLRRSRRAPNRSWGTSSPPAWT